MLQAAIDAFIETGYHGSTMRTIAERAGISVPGVYHHYRSKQELLVRILDLAMDELDWRLAAARDSQHGPLERLAALIEALALFYTQRSDLAFIGVSEMRSVEAPNQRRIAARRTAVQHLLDVEIQRRARPTWPRLRCPPRRDGPSPRCARHCRRGSGPTAARVRAPSRMRMRNWPCA